MTHRLLCLLTVAICLAISTLAQPSNPTPNTSPRTYTSPSHSLKGVVLPVDKLKGYESCESRVEIRDKNGKMLASHDFSSEDGSHGYGVTQSQWTPDGQFFVFTMSNSGGHSPMFSPVVLWSRANNHFYELKNYTASQAYAVSPPDKVTLSTWPGLQPKTILLQEISPSEMEELR